MDRPKAPGSVVGYAIWWLTLCVAVAIVIGLVITILTGVL